MGEPERDAQDRGVRYTRREEAPAPGDRGASGAASPYAASAPSRAQSAPIADDACTPPASPVAAPAGAVPVAAPTSETIAAPAPASAVVGAAVVARRVTVVPVSRGGVAVIAISARRGVTVTAPPPTPPTDRGRRSALTDKASCVDRLRHGHG